MRGTPRSWVLVLGLACGQSPDPPPVATAARDAPGPGPTIETRLPADRPARFEIEYRTRSQAGVETIVKVTTQAIRYGIGDEAHRVTLTYDADPATLDRVYQTLREVAFDRIRTQRSPEASAEGSSLRLLAGNVRHLVATMGRTEPSAADADAYARAASAVQSLVPTIEPAAATGTIEIRWDPLLADRPASLDLALGARLAGVTPLGPAPADVAVHLRDASAPVTLQLRHGSPPVVNAQAVQAAALTTVSVALDERTGTPQLHIAPTPARGIPARAAAHQ